MAIGTFVTENYPAGGLTPIAVYPAFTDEKQ